MQRSIIIALLLTWVQAYLFGPELLRLPLLVSHYVEHCAEEEGLSFSSFIAEHYADAAYDEDCDTEHDGLPYHHHHGSADPGPAPVFITDISSSSGSSATVLGALSALPCEMDLLAGHTRGLIQPPRGLRS